MKKILTCVVTLALAVSLVMSGCTQQTPQPAASQESETQYISKEDLKSDIEGSKNFIILDIRKVADFNENHIKGAVSADVDSAVSNSDNGPATENLKAALGAVTGSETGDSDSKFVLVCYSGKRYAAAATEILKELGVSPGNLYTLEGGNNGWSESGDAFTSLMERTMAEGEEATSDPNIIINKEKKEVYTYAEVNAKYFTEPTRHGVVFKDGSNGEKSVLRGLGDEKVFYDAMVAVGFEPSNKLTIEDMKKGVYVEGEPLDVFVSWSGGDEIPFADIIKASEERPMDLRFGGNIDNAKDKNTGCVLCLDSCAVGIVSNASYETGASDTIQFYGKDDVLPEDGTKVKVIFRARAN